MSLPAVHPPLVELAWSTDDRAARLARNAALVLGGSALLTLSAKLQLPFYPVPITMQTFAVLVIGMACGWRLGGATVLAYLAQGALGLPVFAYGGGLPYFAGPTGGYLVGFLFAAMLTGWLAERGFDRRASTTALAMTLGTALILLCGSTWLAFLGRDASPWAAGALPFLLPAVFKIGLATLLLPTVRQFLSQRLSRD